MSLIRTEITDGVAVVTLDDPTRRNALSLQLCSELEDAFDSIESDPAVGAAVITGAAPAFCAGADLSQLGDSRREGLMAIYQGFLRVARSSLPTVAAVNGAAVGAGMNLALAADIRMAGRSARFDARFLDLGIHPGGGHTWMLRRLVGPQAAMALVVFGQKVDGTEAEQIGLAWRCVEDDALLGEATGLAARAASMPRQLSRRAKATIADMASVAGHADAVERELVDQLWSMDEPAFAQRLAELRSAISGCA